MRGRIILLAAAGLKNKQIAEKLKVAPRMATLWRDHFNKSGIKGLLNDAPRPGQEKHRHQEWLKFLRMIDKAVAAGKEIHTICDNYGTHKHPNV
jgi:transposase